MSNQYPGYPGGPQRQPAQVSQQQYAGPGGQYAGPGGQYAGQQGYPPALRPGGFAPSPADWGTQNAAVAPPPNMTGPIEQVWAPGQARSNRHLVSVIGYTLGGIMMLILIMLVMLETGVAATTASFVLALVPLTTVLAGVMWLDRWEPEPKAMLLLALLWGGGVAALSSYYINSAMIQWIFEQTQDGQGATMLGATIVAPVVEETSKGLGVLLIFLLRRHHFDGPVDGVVYAATVAAGFAFTENILYFSQSADFVWVVFVMRGIASPFAHVLFTSVTGIALGMASRSRRSTAVLFAFPAGLVGAMGLHALWNGSASLGNNFIWLYLFIQVPMFIATLVLLAWLRRQESDVIRARLGEYAQAGWFAPHEVDMLSSMRMRNQAKSWASGYGDKAKDAMKAFHRDSTALAYLRQRLLTGRAGMRASQSEHELLNQIHRDRHVFTASAQGLLQR